MNTNTEKSPALVRRIHDMNPVPEPTEITLDDLREASKEDLNRVVNGSLEKHIGKRIYVDFGLRRGKLRVSQLRTVKLTGDPYQSVWVRDYLKIGRVYVEE